jgi:hypothetical protein
MLLPPGEAIGWIVIVGGLLVLLWLSGREDDCGDIEIDVYRDEDDDDGPGPTAVVAA